MKEENAERRTSNVQRPSQRRRALIAIVDHAMDFAVKSATTVKTGVAKIDIIIGRRWLKSRCRRLR